MMKNLNIWFTDLDNTLIFSHRHEIPSPKLLAEYYQGREQSYMTELTLQFLQRFSERQGHLFVPLTTRKREQYERIFLLREKLSYSYALIANGAVLLKNGEENEQWTRDTLKMIEPAAAHLEKVYEVMQEHLGREHLHRNDTYMVYARTENDPAFFQYLEKTFAPHGIQVFYSGSKLHCFPAILSKGTAVKRFLSFLREENNVGTGDIRTISSGDSSFDLSMLQETDISIYPDALSPFMPQNKQGYAVSGFFSDEICRILSRKIPII